MRSFKQNASTEERQLSLQERFSRLFQHVCDFHMRNASWSSAHDLTHDLLVAGYAVTIADDLAEAVFETTELHEAAWVAAMLHSTDRFVQPDEYLKHVTNVLKQCVTDLGLLTANMSEQVLTAVIEHNKLNKDTDGPVTIILKDADRLANINPLVTFRAAQFYHTLPTHDPHHLEMKRLSGSSYAKPLTIMDDVFSCTEWETWLRVPMARKLAAPYFVFLTSVFRLTGQAHAEAGVSQEVLASDPVAEYLRASEHSRAETRDK